MHIASQEIDHSFIDQFIGHFLNAFRVLTGQRVDIELEKDAMLFERFIRFEIVMHKEISLRMGQYGPVSRGLELENYLPQIVRGTTVRDFKKHIVVVKGQYIFFFINALKYSSR